MVKFKVSHISLPSVNLFVFLATLTIVANKWQEHIKIYTVINTLVPESD